MTERGIFEQLTQRGFGVAVIHHANDSVTVRVVGPAGQVFRATTATELQSAVHMWNRLGPQPNRPARAEERFAEFERLATAAPVGTIAR